MPNFHLQLVKKQIEILEKNVINKQIILNILSWLYLYVHT